MNIHSVNSKSLFSLGYKSARRQAMEWKIRIETKLKDGLMPRLAESGIPEQNRPPLCSGGPIVKPY